MAGAGASTIEHLVVLMLENRSLDNLLGWLWEDRENRPPVVLPAGSSPTYDGLVTRTGDAGRATYWNPSNLDFFRGAPPDKLYLQRGADDFTVPTPDPEESFDHMTFQIFGSEPPSPTAPDPMRGFYLDFLDAVKAQEEKATASTASAGNGGASSGNAGLQILQSYTPEQLPVLHTLARHYAVSDAWFGSCPCQTWPNRAFVHAGTSNGRVDNGSPPDPFQFDIPTIFQVLEERGVSWGVFNDSPLISLTRAQFPKLWSLELEGHFHGLDHWKSLAADGKLPTYSFLEPSFFHTLNDGHPPNDLRLAEELVAEVYGALVVSPAWEQTVFVLLFDENGGCADHVPPPFGAVAPDAASDPGEEGFRFDRFGPRVPAIVVSPWIEAGTVFRSDNGTPYDHTGILATLRDLLEIPQGAFLPSRRIERAPTLLPLLTRTEPRTDRLELPAPVPGPRAQPPADAPLNPLHDLLLCGGEARRLGRSITPAEAQVLRSKAPNRTAAEPHLPRRHEPPTTR